MKASFVLPPCVRPDSLTGCVQSVLSQDWANLEVVLFRESRDARNPAQGLARDPRVVILDADGAESLPRLLNRAISRASGDALLFVADCVTFLPEFTASYLDRLSERPNLAWAYGPFQEAGDGRLCRVRDVRTDAYDYSEGAQIGPVRGIKRACLDAVGGYDEGLSHAFEYDLRLRTLERYEAVRVDEPLYSVWPRNDPGFMRPEMEHYRCYVRSAETPRPRSYLDYHAGEEREFRDACYRSLQRRGALLHGPPGPLACPHVASQAQPVTVVIPLWNREEYIGPALESVLQSRGCEFEVVVVDNGSTDRGPDIVEDYRRRGPVRLIRNDANNIARALNAGIRASSGKYVCQLDSDDLYTPDTLRLLVQYMEAHPNAALGVSYYDCIGPDGKPIPDRGVVRHLEYDPNNLLRTDGVGHARIWHRCVLERLGGFNEAHLGNYAEDYDLQLKLGERYELLRIPHVLYRYRMNHKKPGENIDYCERHAKKTRARREAVERRQRLTAGV